MIRKEGVGLVVARALLLIGVLAGCVTNLETGERELDTVAVVEGLSLAGAILEIVNDDLDAPRLDEIVRAANGVDAAIADFCRLDSWDKATVRRMLDERDPALRPWLLARYGGDDGDVCTADSAALPLPDV